MKKLKTVLLAASLGAMLVGLMAIGAKADEIFDITGNVGNGFDAEGLFVPGLKAIIIGQGPTFMDESYQGDPFQIVYDFNFAGTGFSPSSLTGTDPSFYGFGSQSPLVSASITINGVTVNFNGNTDPGSSSNGSGYIAPGEYSVQELGISENSGTTVLTGDPGTLNVSLYTGTITSDPASVFNPSFQGNFSINAAGSNYNNFGSLYYSSYDSLNGAQFANVNLSLNATYITGYDTSLTGGAPEISTWMMMSIGFGASLLMMMRKNQGFVAA